MMVTGLSPGVWAFDPLHKSPLNPICCPRHLQIADFLTVCLELKREMALALMSLAKSPAAGDDEYLDRILFVGMCGSPLCATAGV